MKPNPRRIPRTQADVDRATRDGHIHGAEFMLYLVLFVLSDKHDAPHDELQQLGKEVEMYCGQLNKGEIKLRDVKLALKEEYDITVRI